MRMRPAAALALRMVSAAKGEVLWSASTTGEGDTLDEAADDAARHILRAVKRTWPPQ